MKICSKCNQEKPYESFNKKAAAKDGYFPWCKQCLKEYDRQRWPERYKKEAPVMRERATQYYTDHKEERLSYISSWIKSNKDKHSAYIKKYVATEKGKRSRKRSTQKFRENNPEKLRVWAITRRALKRGIISLESSCKYCGSDKRLGFHHPNYSLPLAIETVCNRCHGKITQGLSPLIP